MGRDEERLFKGKKAFKGKKVKKADAVVRGKLFKGKVKNEK